MKIANKGLVELPRLSQTIDGKGFSSNQLPGAHG
jgi:hypothetical protein